MEQDFIRNRITQLRLEKGISEYQLSLELGHSRGYIQNISSGKALPSMEGFLDLCDYFGITPTEFFDTDQKYPALAQQISDGVKDLSNTDMLLILNKDFLIFRTIVPKR